MTTYILSTAVTPSGKKNSNSSFIDVISSVVSRPSNVFCSCGLLAKFSLWPEGTDPALRGREGRREAKRVTGGMT